ncbi:MAG: hypothetical protein GTO14_15785 [Anaerolineales bacterium]|nr:hypothetical protein [Anaerolineales bacterium]
MPVVQYVAYYRSLARGLNPDRPRNVYYWVDNSGWVNDIEFGDLSLWLAELPDV